MEYINPLAFSGLERLSALNLVNNELRTVDSAMQSTLPSTLRVLRLYRNPWTCNCRLRWLRRWLVSPVTRTSSTVDVADLTVNWDFASNTPTCAAPALIRGVAWRHLTPDQFACPSRIVAVSAAGTSANGTTKTGIRATSGLNATVKCMAAGDPEPIISWSRGDRGGHVLAPPTAMISVRQATVGDDGEPRIVSVLTLLSVTASRDSGDYSCMAENTAGRAEMTFKLIVDDAPLADTSRTTVWPVDRDAFLGILLGLLAVVCIVVVCTVIRLRSIARRRCRLHSKNVYYVADTANHVGPSPTSNHLPPTDIESTPTPVHTAVDDQNSKSSEEQSFLGDGKRTVGSPKYPLLHNYNQQCSERSVENNGRGRKKQNEVSCRRAQSANSGEAHSLLGADGGGELELANSVTDDEVRDKDDDVSLSEKLSDVASEDTDDGRTNGDDATNHRERPNRAVSFGPDMIIDARRRSSSGERENSPHDNDVFDADDSTEVKLDYDEETVFQRSTVTCSPSVDRRPLTSRPSVTTDTLIPTLSTGDSCRYTFAAVGAGRRHSGELGLVGNGSVRSGSGSRLAAHPLSPQTTSAPLGQSRPPSQSTSLERNAGGKIRRLLPVPGLWRSSGPGMFDRSGRRQGASSPRDVALPGNHVAECTPVSLAELLAPPFGGTTSALRELGQRRQTKTVSDSQRSAQLQHRSNANYVSDDDSGTDI